jgi:hypothetical protein
MDSEEVLRNPGVQHLPTGIETSKTDFFNDPLEYVALVPTAEFPGGAQEVTVAPWTATPYPTTG